MSKHRWWILGSVVAVIAIVAVAGVALLRDRSDSDCTTVRSMIDYNREFNRTVKSSTNEQPDYHVWATKIGGFADQIRDGDLARRADNLAELAKQTESIVPQFRNDASDMADRNANPPQYMQEYARIGQQFNTDLAALAEACPA